MNDKTGGGITVYLMEELTDARLRCDQLKRYVDQAMRLVSQSSQRDHVYEVAGNLLYGIPDALMRLDKALSATALAASRLDYEELKQELRPEKVEELENVLKDVRIRRFDRSSSEAEGTTMIKFATGTDVAKALRQVASSIESQERRGVNPSRSAIVASLMRIVSNVDPRLAESAKQSRFEEGKPADPTKEMSPEDAKKWEESNDEHEDKFKKKEARFEGGKPADPTKHMSPEDAKKWEDANDEHGDKFKKEAFANDVYRAVAKVQRALTHEVINPLKVLARSVDDQGIYRMAGGEYRPDTQVSDVVRAALAGARKAQEALTYMDSKKATKTEELPSEDHSVLASFCGKRVAQGIGLVSDGARLDTTGSHGRVCLAKWEKGKIALQPVETSQALAVQQELERVASKARG
jgi:hypothetical protein